MELFKITCVTCRARLGVRDVGAIGKIIACPRCGSMVQVTKPEGFDAAAALAAAAAPVAPARPAAVPAMSTAAPSSGSFEQNVLFEPETLSPSDGGAMAPTVGAAASEAAPASAPETASSWWSLKLAAVVAGAAIGGAVIVAGVVIWKQGDQPAVVHAAVEPAAGPEAKTQAAVDLRQAAADTEPAPVAEEQVASEVEPPGEVVEKASKEPAPEPVVAPAETTASVDVPPPAPTPPVEAPAVSIASAAPAPEVTPPPADEPPRRLSIDPLAIDPEGLDLAMLLNGPTREPELSSVVGNPAPRQSAADVPNAADGVNPVPAPEPPSASGNAAPQDADAVLARKYPKITVEKMPLCRLLDFATRLSGLPVSVAPAELRAAGISAAAPVTANAEDATIEKFLEVALEPLRLVPQVGDRKITLVRTGGDPVRTITYPLDDLAANGDSAKQLAAWVKQLTAASATMQLDGARLRLDQPQSAQYETLVFLERYRLACGLAQRSKYPANLLGPVAASRTLHERLAGPVTFTFAAPTPLREVCRYWQEELGVAILVDWPALAEARLWPQSPVRASAAAKPWSEALDAALAPLDLGWRAIGPRAIEITTLAKIAEQPSVEVYALDETKLRAGDSPVDHVAQLAKEAVAPNTDGAKTIAFYDAPHHVLLVRSSAKVERRIAEWLASEKLLAEPTPAGR